MYRVLFETFSFVQEPWKRSEFDVRAQAERPESVYWNSPGQRELSQKATDSAGLGESRAFPLNKFPVPISSKASGLLDS